METATAPNPVRPWLRPLLLVAGILFLVIGVIGVFLPLIPTTGPLLLAAYFFGRSSNRFHTWLYDHPRFGPFIRDFQAGRGVPLRTKVFALVAMTASFTYATVWAVSHPAARIAVGTVGFLALAYVFRLPTRRTA
jgi:uncharacterized membrane protein YbaN (DUF454 family)